MLTGVAHSSFIPAELYAESKAANFGFSESEFAALLSGVLRGQAELLKGLRVNDLVLARACARGNEAAWECFLERYRERMYLAAAAIARDEEKGRDLADSLYADLYGTRVRQDGQRVSKLESFQGRGSLEGWLKTILAQEYVNRFRSQRKLIPFDDALEAPSTALAIDNDGSAAEQAALAKATDAALASLDEEEGFLLAAYYLDQRRLAEIGRMLGMHESTVSRRLDKVTARLRKQIVGLLGKEGVPRRAAEEMLELDVRDLGVNVREKLAQGRRG
jgi:RNA polymerase sigma-70 factor, ECF subfamily